MIFAFFSPRLLPTPDSEDNFQVPAAATSDRSAPARGYPSPRPERASQNATEGVATVARIAVRLSGIDGLAVLWRVQALAAPSAVIMITAVPEA